MSEKTTNRLLFAAIVLIVLIVHTLEYKWDVEIEENQSQPANIEMAQK